MTRYLIGDVPGTGHFEVKSMVSAHSEIHGSGDEHVNDWYTIGIIIYQTCFVMYVKMAMKSFTKQNFTPGLVYQ